MVAVHNDMKRWYANYIQTIVQSSHMVHCVIELHFYRNREWLDPYSCLSFYEWNIILFNQVKCDSKRFITNYLYLLDIHGT